MRSAAHLELVRESISTAATLAHERTLAVDENLVSIVPSGALQRGSSVAVHGVGATSFGLAVVAQAIRDGAFLAVIAPDSFSLAPCLDFDLPLRRVVQFVFPSGIKPQQWAAAVAAIIEGFDIVMLADRHHVRGSYSRQLTARNRERGSVLVRVGGPPWSNAADLRFDVGSPDWSGLGHGHGYLQKRKVSVQVAGRRVHSSAQTHDLWLPARSGGVELALPEVTEFPKVAELPKVADPKTAQLAGVAASTPSASRSGERFAGADIDEMLDVVDGQLPHRMCESDRATSGLKPSQIFAGDQGGRAGQQGGEQDQGASDLNATA